MTVPIPARASTAEIHAAPDSSPSPAEIMAMARGREASLSRLLMAFIVSGIAFMLLPGTFLGVWNLFRISAHESITSVPPAWLQAHGHAQVFGWVGSFILGIGFYSVPRFRHKPGRAFGAAWACWALWTTGVAARWVANVYGFQWRWLLPVSAVMELAAFLIFFRLVSQHRPEPSAGGRLGAWIWVVAVASMGLLAALAVNLGATSDLAARGAGPAFPHGFDQHYIVLMAWGFLAPFVWGFSAKWMPIFLGLKLVRWKWLFAALAMNTAGVVATFAGFARQATVLFLAGAAMAIVALRMFEPARQAAKTRGVHRSFPYFVRLAYGWLLVSALLGTGAALWDSSGGIWGASRHALTVGFVALTVLCVGQRVLPAFAGMRLLWSTRLMFSALALLTVGCALRVPSEILAYQGYAHWAWSVLPVSATVELAGITAFAVNILGTFIFQPSHASKEPLIVATVGERYGHTEVEP